MIRLLTAYAPELEAVAQKLADQTPFVCQSPILNLPEPIKYLLKTVWQSPDSPGLKRLYFEWFCGCFVTSLTSFWAWYNRWPRRLYGSGRKTTALT
ncbi:hypothetical protein [Siphonobacter sp. BAB-5405]|uniref:hypothetical protein n=1 Tax=Siphonobacter sp. BAB-5405 TaxID=1864825 RepID=UPI0011AF3DFA|nr:hypothetical protein [Siphonobacter sp. BAB-5405]